MNLKALSEEMVSDTQADFTKLFACVSAFYKNLAAGGTVPLILNTLYSSLHLNQSV